MFGKKYLFLILLIPIFFIYQNCSDLESSSDIGSLENSSVNSSSLSYKEKRKSLGLIYGPNATQEVIDKTESLGGWYYTYSTHPNRDEPGRHTNTVRMANRNDKEFVPMVHTRYFITDETGSSCPLLNRFRRGNEGVCTISEMVNSLEEMKSLFSSSNQPKHIMVFNEPWRKGDQFASSTGEHYALTPWQAAASYSLIEVAAKRANLNVVGPTIGDGDSSVLWFSEFLKRCHDLRNDSEFRCKLSGIRTFSYHAYQCHSSFFEEELGERKLQYDLINLMKNSDRSWYGGYNWEKYILSRKIWLTETTCNWDKDVKEAQYNGQYIRTQKKSCQRATGQQKGYGSLPVLIDLPKDRLERFAWWTTYANPKQDSDVGQINQSSVNRITAARLVDDKNEYTPMGRAIESLWLGNRLSQVNCSE